MASPSSSLKETQKEKESNITEVICLFKALNPPLLPSVIPWGPVNIFPLIRWLQRLSWWLSEVMYVGHQAQSISSNATFLVPTWIFSFSSAFPLTVLHLTFKNLSPLGSFFSGFLYCTPSLFHTLSKCGHLSFLLQVCLPSGDLMSVNAAWESISRITLMAQVESPPSPPSPPQNLSSNFYCQQCFFPIPFVSYFFSPMKRGCLLNFISLNLLSACQLCYQRRSPALYHSGIWYMY